jgi:regulator of G-protein signaling 3/regulator of G-protein signaling
MIPTLSEEKSAITLIMPVDSKSSFKQIFKRGTDMKFRWFLKRRHTEGTIHSTSVRPHPEEAKKWTNSFADLMASKYGQALFRAFLQREFSDENIEFWLAIEDYRKTRQNKITIKAQKIYNDFIVAQAPKEVNLDSLTREGLVSKMLTPNATTFDQAQKRIQGLLEGDAYIRFLKSDLYLELLHPEKYQP